MSRPEYEESRQIQLGGFSFYGLLMAAMRQADDVNTAKLSQAFPEVWEELKARYGAPGGVLRTDPDGGMHP